MYPYQPDLVSHPGEMLAEALEERDNMSQKELAARTGRPLKTINEIIQGKASITSETALQLEKVLQIPAKLWLQYQANHDESVARQAEAARFAADAEWIARFPIRDMTKCGWLPETKDKQQVRDSLLSFYAVANPKGWNEMWMAPSARFRISLAHTTSPEAVSAWLRHGELCAGRLELPGFNPKRFREALLTLRTLVTELRWEVVQRAMREECTASGVALVFTRCLSHAPISGAVRWIHERPVLQLSGRFKQDHHIWFTFFHEAAHILLHGKQDVFLEGTSESDSQHQAKEDEANDFAANLLVPPAERIEFIEAGDFSKASILAFAKRINVSPGIVVGQLQKLQVIGYSTRLNYLKTSPDLSMDDIPLCTEG
jgi:HTH-type transcriptional regulator/antitoxin HigA